MSRQNMGRVATSLLLAGMLAQADTLVFRNGSRMDGSYLGGDNRTIRFAVADRVNTYNLSDVQSVLFTGGGPGAPAAYGQGGPAPYGQGPYGPASSQGADNSGAANSGWNNRPSTRDTANTASDNSGIQVPAGTMLTVRLIDPVDSQNDRLGQTYRASLDQPVVVNGQTILPRGADAVATLIDSKKSGKIEGRTSLTLDLKNVTVNGKQYDITTTGVSEESSSRGARSAKVIGGTAALGAIIGAVAGGGKGAAIGAGSGAAVGTAAQVVTSGQRVKVPAETRLNFTLQNPITL